ncbi:MAG TPA: hypothetical protein VFV70_09350 [Hyphomonadaceae bacterium]|nr:hypothetical protein [Hyphomonadaceae bacterium]
MGRLSALSVIALLGAACAAAPANDQETSDRDAEASKSCPHRIVEANAWVNHMPGPGRSNRELHVDVRLAETTDTAILLKSDASTADNLVLDVRTSSAAPVPGRTAYREPVPDPLPKRITFRCQGGEIERITQIEKVY